MKHVKNFFIRGLMFGGFGPIIAGIVYLSLHFNGQVNDVSGLQIFMAIISTYILAFIQAGASVFNQIENWPIAKSTAIHFSTIYLAYMACYLINSWLPLMWEVILIFTASFIGVYFVIWLTVYVVTKKLSAKLNKQIENR